MTTCTICNNTGKRPGSDFLDCTACGTALARAELNHAVHAFQSAYQGDNANLQQDLHWFIHQRALVAAEAQYADKIAGLERDKAILQFQRDEDAKQSAYELVGYILISRQPFSDKPKIEMEAMLKPERAKELLGNKQRAVHRLCLRREPSESDASHDQ